MAKTKVLLKFADDENFYKCEVQRMSEHMIKVSGLVQDLSGFQIFSDSHVMIGDYSTYVYEYDNPNLDENVFEYTDNGANYPEEGADKSLKETIKDELKTIILEQSQSLTKQFTEAMTKTTKSIDELMDKTSDVNNSQLEEIQESIIDIYTTMQEILVALHSKDTTDEPTDVE